MASSVIHLPQQATQYRFQLSSRPRLHDDDEERSQEHLAAQLKRLRVDTLPELDRIERMLTRLVISYGLEYCHLDKVAKSFLAFSRDARELLGELETAKSSNDISSPMLNAAQQNATNSLAYFRDVITSDLTCQEATPIYRKLITTLTTFETNTSRLFTAHSSCP